MRKVVLVFVVIAVVALLTATAGDAPTPTPAPNSSFQTMVTNLCPFSILVEFKHDGMGVVETASCPAFGTDMIGELYKGGHTVTVLRMDTGVMFTQKHVMVGDMHHTVKIHPNGEVTLHP